MSGNSEIELLIARAADGSLTHDEAATLLAACRQDSNLLGELRDQLAMERLLGVDGGRRDIPEGFTKEILSKISGERHADEGFTPRVMGQLSDKPISIFPRIVAMAALVVISLSAWFLWKADSTPRVVASVTGAEAAAGFGTRKEFSVGQSLVLDSGFVRLRFGKGAELILEGPAELEFSGDNGAVLRRGVASVRVPESATGFTLVGPDAKVLDVGTEFAMKVSPDQPTEVHVIDGLILTSTTRDPSQSEMRKDDAIEVIDGNARKIPATPRRFLNDLPDRKPGLPGFLHWTFDEPKGAVLANIGPGIAGFDNPALLRTAKPESLDDIHVEGVFGPGIFLDGESAFVETDFPGIGGTGARTVAMWVKVPGDWQPHNGYAMASWGSFEEKGGAWQISVNPGDEGGAVGHLRIGTHNDYVVGKTDLRDGRWHHVAAVMYGGKGATAATHILLYVDGELEHTEVKSTLAINTDIDSATSVKLQLGRNILVPLGFALEKRYFRGWIDEVVVADGALSQSQVRSLMKSNRIE